MACSLLVRLSAVVTNPENVGFFERNKASDRDFDIHKLDRLEQYLLQLQSAVSREMLHESTGKVV